MQLALIKLPVTGMVHLKSGRDFRFSPKYQCLRLFPASLCLSATLNWGEGMYVHKRTCVCDKYMNLVTTHAVDSKRKRDRQRCPAQAIHVSSF